MAIEESTLVLMPMLLQVLPTPTGGQPIASQFTTQFSGNFQTDLNRLVSAMNKAGDKQLAVQFRAYALQLHAQQPELGMQQILNAFTATELAGGIGTGIS